MAIFKLFNKASLDDQMIKAMNRNKPQKVLHLLSLGASMHVYSRLGTTPLTWASWKGHADIVQAAIQRGAKIDTPDKYHATALMYAAAYDHPDIVQLLIDRGADVNLNTDQTALMCAAGYGHPDIVQRLIDHGADVNLTNTDGNTALQVAKKSTCGSDAGKIAASRILQKVIDAQKAAAAMTVEKTQAETVQLILDLQKQVERLDREVARLRRAQEPLPPQRTTLKNLATALSDQPRASQPKSTP